MAEDEMVSGEGWISDDSSFYGDQNEQGRQLSFCGNFNIESFWRTHHKDLNTVTMAAGARRRAKVTSTGKASISNKAAPNAGSATSSKLFNMSTIDRIAIEQERLARSGKRKRGASPEPAPTLELFNPLQGRPDAWQLGESVDVFIKRLPPYTTSIFTCPWIWAENPHPNPRDKSAMPRVEDFTSRGTHLLAQSLESRRQIQAKGSHGLRSMVTKLLNQESKALQQRIVDVAMDTHVISGKWMLFPNSTDVTRVWRQVVTGVIDNRLGTTCKVATDDGKDERLICVYTKDFQDADDVLRVLYELNTMGLLNSGKSIYYKPDAYTYLELKGETAAEYGLKASMYNSRSMMAAGRL
ncbi:DUF1917-domain-containing protein [Clathrospora elynae]|uniref:DUF1917-domain-containing protein n=1 Tax=Clathrospora elynae TaxID=706981 RepID=A0A6A5SE79_9PLEO|nr:DUF1917-domain-containing protein [Clathrospora elynae]